MSSTILYLDNLAKMRDKHWGLDMADRFNRLYLAGEHDGEGFYGKNIEDYLDEQIEEFLYLHGESFL